MSLIDHLERYLGRIALGWSDTNSESGVQVAVFEDVPAPGILTYSTIGMSSRLLLRRSGKPVREELLVSAYERFDRNALGGFLFTLADYLLQRGEPLVRGDIIGPESPVILGTLLNAVYVSLPIVYDDELQKYNETTPPTIFPWVIPIHENEVAYVRSHGWKKFEALLEKSDPDLWDLRRTSVL